MGGFWKARALAVAQALLAMLVIAVPSGARASSAPVRLVETCRIVADSGEDVRGAIERLRRCDNPASKTLYGTVWVEYSRLPATMIPKTWRLNFDNHALEALDLWLVSKSGQTQHVAYAPNAPDREWSAGNYFSLLVTPHTDVDRIVIRLTGSETHQYIRAPKIARAKDFAPVERDQAALYGIGVGMLALTVLFHLNLFFAMRRRFQLIYCAHVALLFVYALCYSGIVRIGLPALGSSGISMLVTFALTAATATGTAFVTEFLCMSMPRWVRRWAGVATSLSLGAAGLVMVAPHWLGFYAYYAANIAALHAIAVTTTILIAACIRRLPLAGTVAIGWVVPIFVSLMYPARAFGLISEAAVPDGLLLLSVTIECLILSLPVTARIRNLRIEHERAHERHIMLERQAQTDVLTGLANRRGFNDALARAAANHVEPMPLAVLVIDIDHFKRVNDQYGHASGDQILRHVAMHVAKVSGAGAIVSRYGGEEFVVALRGHDLMRAGTIAERIRCSIGVTFEAETELPPVTISIGVAAGFSDEVDSMLADADCALYRAKNEGRNRVMLADGPIVYAAAA